MNYSKYSCVIIGSGISGLYCALKIADSMDLPDDLLIVTKSKIEESNSNYAQGGIVCVLSENREDKFESHISDTLKAGCGLCDFETVRIVSENSERVIEDLLRYEVPFDTDEEGRFLLTMEGAHSVKRILHSGGDATGRNINKVLIEQIKKRENIVVYENTSAIELLVDKGNVCKGIITFNNNTQQYETVYSQAIILATGGIGQLYKNTTNSKIATGDGICLAYRASAKLQDLEMVQFHPTALKLREIDSEKMFLISEAVRGEGAKLVDIDGCRFMEKYDKRLELAPRDIVTRCVFNEMEKSNYNCMYLDARNIGSNFFARRFPTIFEVCNKFKINIDKDLIPITPAAHYFMGGIKTKIDGKSTIENLYAIGEVSSTGLHGGNRLASNSLLECVVSGYLLSKSLQVGGVNLNVSDSIDENILKTINNYSSKKIENIRLFENEYKPCNIELMKNRLQEIMWERVGIVRNEKGLRRALTEIESLKEEFKLSDICFTSDEYEFRNMLTVASLITQSALNRKYSCGAHYVEDSNRIEINERVEHQIIMKENRDENLQKQFFTM